MFSVTPRSVEQGQLLLQWEDNESIDFWEQISRTGKSSRIMTAPDIQMQFENFLKENDIDHELIIGNVERFFQLWILLTGTKINFHFSLKIYRVFERERQDKAEAKNRMSKIETSGQPRNGNFEYYWSYSEINRYLTQLTLLYGDICHTETLGQHYFSIKMNDTI